MKEFAVCGYVKEIEWLLRSVNMIVRKRGRDILSAFGITPPQYNALYILNRDGSLTMGELCQKMYLAFSTMTDLINRMERNGYIERIRDEKDRRVVRLRVTERGQRVIHEVLSARLRYLSLVLDRVSAEDKARLITSLKQLHELMTQEVGLEQRAEAG